MGLQPFKKSSAALGEVPIGIGLVLELRLDRWICFFRSQAVELARVLKVLFKF
jgi:hypothetical protein